MSWEYTNIDIVCHTDQEIGFKDLKLNNYKCTYKLQKMMEHSQAGKVTV